ncbi:hypothetical protein Poli38472_012272 [Pythium oligandrum]|uniref:Selenoprotein T n=1 Tax=Pythium oligandrum TaxID=41045 RepID=A0A8K1FLH7_PYTOL|nr:hypothetical protein Poli38472_012272 [Pythium oligandrum]|eukprot:TMW67156.1 hypothetical protein Poli38472_012272 [Pythium oligandrum]
MTRTMSMTRRVLALLALCVFVLSTAMPMVLAKEAETTESVPTNHNALVDDEVRVFFCSSCGFRQNFGEVKQYLEDKYPHLVDRIYGENYEVGPLKNLAARALGVLQLVGMVLLVAGEQIFRMLGWDSTLLQKALDNRIGCFAVIILIGSISQGLVSTGAFEVYYNNDLIFSKLQAERWPTLNELSELLEAKGIRAAY